MVCLLNHANLRNNAYFGKNSIEMVVRKDIVAVSIPFSAGVVTAALLPPGGDVPYWLAAGSCLAAAALSCLYAGRGDRSGTVLLLYFVLGLFCHASAAARGPGAGGWAG
ncbi:MAG: hypothetical protein IJ603_00800, partial [Bacteroidales bacterium]|nr:hypothetical protein [Bacteroidales bacterium]